jgi:hypothetical protein
VRGDAEDVDAAGGVLDDQERIQPVQAGRSSSTPRPRRSWPATCSISTRSGSAASYTSTSRSHDLTLGTHR